MKLKGNRQEDIGCTKDQTERISGYQSPGPTCNSTLKIALCLSGCRVLEICEMPLGLRST